MIASLSGKLRRSATDYLIVEVGGVGYRIQSPLSTVSILPPLGGDVSLHVYTHVREDTIALYGFLTEPEKEMFLFLLGVSGIGPRTALAVLSCLSVPDIASALQTSDDARLCAIPGIGKKTAARLVLELKDKIKLLSLPSAPHGGTAHTGTTADDAVAALLTLGYKKTIAEDAVEKAMQRCRGHDVQAILREALRVLMKQ